MLDKLRCMLDRHTVRAVDNRDVYACVRCPFEVSAQELHDNPWASSRLVRG